MCVRVCVCMLVCMCVCVWQYAMDTEARLDQLRILVEAADKEKVELLNQLEEEKRWGPPSSRLHHWG